MIATHWNGEPVRARRCLVVVGPAPNANWWCVGMEGTERQAVEVIYGQQRFFLDNEDGKGWAKVTEGQGSPRTYHKSVPVARVVRYED